MLPMGVDVVVLLQGVKAMVAVSSAPDGVGLQVEITNFIEAFKELTPILFSLMISARVTANWFAILSRVSPPWTT